VSGASEFKKGTCGWCEAEGEVYRDNSLCDRCDSDVVFCSVCKERQHADHQPCRHVFQDRHGQWVGSGYVTEPNIRVSFHDLLDAMPVSFASDLRKAIRSGGFYTWIIAPLIGGGGLLELNGMDYRLGRSYGDAVLRLGQETHYDDHSVSDGWHWLASLYKRSTRGANKTTVQWIDEWLYARDTAFDRLADDGCPLHSEQGDWRRKNEAAPE
jgi:hypothetical protein